MTYEARERLGGHAYRSDSIDNLVLTTLRRATLPCFIKALLVARWTDAAYKLGEGLCTSPADGKGLPGMCEHTAFDIPPSVTVDAAD